MKCNYCGTDDRSGKTCDKCGAPLPEKGKDLDRFEPFFYNGFICYWLHDHATETIEVQFWLGRELIERIAVSRELVRYHVGEGYDAMPFFWDLFLVAHGDKEVLEWKEKNNKYPATLQVTRIENPERERWHNMSIQDMAREFAR
jgi:hypothetical protein